MSGANEVVDTDRYEGQYDIQNVLDLETKSTQSKTTYHSREKEETKICVEVSLP